RACLYVDHAVPGAAAPGGRLDLVAPWIHRRRERPRAPRQHGAIDGDREIVRLSGGRGADRQVREPALQARGALLGERLAVAGAGCAKRARGTTSQATAKGAARRRQGRGMATSSCPGTFAAGRPARRWRLRTPPSSPRTKTRRSARSAPPGPGGGAAWDS